MRNLILEWQSRGWDHPMWELLRVYHAVGARGTAQQEWVNNLRRNNHIRFEDNSILTVDNNIVSDLVNYITLRNRIWNYAETRLRSEEEARDFCNRLSVIPGVTATRSQDHHQASKSLVAAVNTVAKLVVDEIGTTLVPDPQTRCAWMVDNTLHVTARRLDGAIPSLTNPRLIWEIKEYWGVTSGGSKMSDAVYECHLVGRELLEYNMKTGRNIKNYVFIDGKIQWTARKSDMLRFFDLNAQGLIDRLYIGKDVEDYWKDELTFFLNNN